MKTNKALIIGTGLLSAFLIWTILVMNVDVQNVGPHGSAIGFSTLNMWFHKITGVHMKLYTITDWLGLIPIMICICFGALGAYQWISRRSIRQVDTDIIILGIYYVCVILAFYLRLLGSDMFFFGYTCDHTIVYPCFQDQ